jgi:hypothetical protein
MGLAFQDESAHDESAHDESAHEESAAMSRTVARGSEQNRSVRDIVLRMGDG